MKVWFLICGIAAELATALAMDTLARAEEPYVHVPSTVSPEWQEYLSKMPSPALRPPSPAVDDLEGWKRLHAAREKEREPDVERALARLEPTVSSRVLGGVPVLEIKPNGWIDNGKVLVYTHGGAYTGLSAHSTLPSSALAADATGLRVISIDYTVAPIATWDQITSQVVDVIKALVADGVSLDRIAIYGDSAGGGLAPGAVLKMRDQGIGMPAAVVLWSPWADITETGDTYVTLKDAEPTYFYDRVLKNSAAAYAEPKDQTNPYVSPVYADFTKGFPPTLIQGGTKEIFLSNFVRLYQALDAAGRPVKLDLYEGMPHVFQPKLPDSPESKLALRKMKAFLDEHLKRMTPVTDSDQSSVVEELREERPAAQNAGPLGGAWVLTELNGKPLEQSAITAEIDSRARRASGSTGVNRWSGNFEMKEQSIKFSPLLLTRRAGSPEAMRREHEFTQALDSATDFQVEGRKLQLISSGKVVLVFQEAVTFGTP